MSYLRNEIIATKEIYHVINHSIGQEVIFQTLYEYRRFIELINFYRFPQKLRYSKFIKLERQLRKDYLLKLSKTKPSVEIFSFSIMPNHYHLLMRQLEDNGISHFIAQIQNAYAKYFNKKNKRNGSLFMRPFRFKRIPSNNILIHVSRYIHLNPVTSYLIDYETLKSYPLTSFPEYLGKSNREFINTNFILKIFDSRKSYEMFVKNQVDYQRSLQRIKGYILEH